MTTRHLKLQVFGSGCASCKRLHERTIQAVMNLGLNTEVEYVTDIQCLIDLGVMQSPVLAINGKPVLIGYVPDIEEIVKIIAEVQYEPMTENKTSGCSCGGKC